LIFQTVSEWGSPGAASFTLNRRWCFPPAFMFYSELRAQWPNLRWKA